MMHNIKMSNNMKHMTNDRHIHDPINKKATCIQHYIAYIMNHIYHASYAS